MYTKSLFLPLKHKYILGKYFFPTETLKLLLLYKPESLILKIKILIVFTCICKIVLWYKVCKVAYYKNGWLKMKPIIVGIRFNKLLIKRFFAKNSKFYRADLWPFDLIDSAWNEWRFTNSVQRVFWSICQFRWWLNAIRWLVDCFLVLLWYSKNFMCICREWRWKF